VLPVGLDGPGFSFFEWIGVVQREFGKWVNVFRIEAFIFLGECRKTEHRQWIGCILN